MARVRGTMKEVKPIEVNIDTVYVRTNIERIEDEEYSCWEYDEKQYGKDEYIEMISKESDSLKNENTELAQSVAELSMAMAMIMGGV